MNLRYLNKSNENARVQAIVKKGRNERGFSFSDCWANTIKQATRWNASEYININVKNLKIKELYTIHGTFT